MAKENKAAQAPEANKEVKQPKVILQSVFKTAEEAVAEAHKRTKGPRRAFTCKAKDGKVFHVIANNEGRAGGAAFMELGGVVNEIGKQPKGKVDINALLDAMNDDERAAILARFQMKK